MNYYKKKRFAFELVRQLYNAGNSDKMIEYKVMLRFGLGSKFVEESIGLLNEITDEGLKNKENEIGDQ